MGNPSQSSGDIFENRQHSNNLVIESGAARDTISLHLNKGDHISSEMEVALVLVSANSENEHFAQLYTRFWVTVNICGIMCAS